MDEQSEDDRPALDYQRAEFSTCDGHATMPDVRHANATTGRKHDYCAWCLKVLAEPMPAADALADAETLRTVARSVYRGFAYRHSDIGRASSLAEGDATAPPPYLGGYWTELAAKYAFRAVPGLRGDK